MMIGTQSWILYQHLFCFPLWMGMTMIQWCPDAQQPRVDKILTSRLTLYIYIHMFILCPILFPHIIQVDIWIIPHIISRASWLVCCLNHPFWLNRLANFAKLEKELHWPGTRVYGGYVLVGFTSKPTNATGRHHLVSLLL